MNDMGKRSEKKAVLLRVFFLILGAVFTAIGILGEEYTIVLNKAVRICLECIGIG